MTGRKALRLCGSFAVALVVGVLAVAAMLVPGLALADSSRFAPVAVAATDLADATGGLWISAAAGHVVFSRTVGGGLNELVEWTPTRGLRVLPVGRRRGPFDADAGRDAAQRPVVTYSTCGLQWIGGKIPPTGCRLRVLRLDAVTARPRTLALRGGSSLSLTTPSMMGRNVVAVAAPRHGSHNVRILQWRTAIASPRRLSGGTATSICFYSGCPSGPRTSVTALDLGVRSIAYVWKNSSGGLGIGGNEELRSAPLDGGHSRQANRAYGYSSGACGYRYPKSPNALRDGGVGFVLAQSPCEDDQTTIARWPPGAADFKGARPSDALVGGAAWDGPRLYWLRCQAKHDPEYDADVISDACRLVVSTRVPFAPPTRRATGG